MNNRRYGTACKFLLCFSILFFVSAPAMAGKSVSSPYVSKGALQLEAKTEYVIDDDNRIDGMWDQSLELGYGFTDRFGAEIGVKFEDKPDQDVETKQIDLETTFQFTDKGAYWIDSAAKLKYKYSTSGSADKIAGEFLVAKTIGKFENVANIEIEAQVGEDSSDREEVGIEWKTKYKYSNMFSFGVEYYGDLGDTTADYEDQEHLIGPVVYSRLGDLKWEAGILGGISDAAPDADLKLNLKYEF